MDPDRTHYATLGVTRDAPQQVVRAAYVALSKLHHPDSGTRPDERRMQDINRAWQVLRDPARRAAYDASLTARARPAASGPADRATGARPGRRPTPPGRAGWGEAADAAAGDADRNGDRPNRQGRRPPTPRPDARRRRTLEDGTDSADSAEGTGEWTPPRGQPAAGWGEFVDDVDDADDAADEVPDEGYGFDYGDGRDPTAVTTRRTIAFAIDLAAVAVLAYICWYVLVLALYEKVERPDRAAAADVCRFVENTTADCHVFGTTAYFHRQYWPLALAVAIPLAVIHVVVQARTGTTPGKALMALRTVKEDGSPPGYTRALIRTVALVLIDMAVWCVPVVGISQVRTNPGHRRVGDRLARTYVVTRSAAGAPIEVPEGPGLDE